MKSGRLHSRVALTCLFTLLALALAAPSVGAQDEPPLHGAEFPIAAEPVEDWTDPAEALGLSEDDLEPAPEIDLSTLDISPILATGVETIAVENDTLGLHAERHLRALQVSATIRRQIDETNRDIDALRPRIDRLNLDITSEHEHEARLTFEIERIKDAIAEFAVRAFIGDEELETAFTEPINDLGESKVLSDGVRDAQFEEIEAKETEREQRRTNRLGLESERRELRSTIDGLQSDRLERLGELRWVEELAEESAIEHQAHLHRRLTDMVDGADFQLVTLNAYVIAARSLAEQAPECAIEWWMLAGIGSIESLHGRFGDSEIDKNGFTTEPIFGPALDGRILEGEEFLTAGSQIPDATGQTEDLPVAPAAAAVEPSAPEAPAAQTEGADATDPATGDPDGEAAEDAPVIRRLALIEDTDGGQLDGDTTFDRAVGPMQFIPQTWRLQEVDADGDGESDPQNIYDAALASANYLCASTPSMATIEGQQQAYFAYNHDDEYTMAVIEASQKYRALLSLPEHSERPEPVVVADDDAAVADDAPPAPSDVTTNWLGVGAYDADAPSTITVELDLPDW